MAAACEVIVGTYEKLILGYELVEEADGEWSFKIVFTNSAHLAPVRCMALSAARGILASAGSDEAVRLLDLKRRVEIGSLPYHSGSVNDLRFHKASHLFSASSDGKMAVWRRRDWKMLKAFKRHRGKPVKGVAIHPTGALALSIGDDKTLRTWDLVAGKNAFAINLKLAAQSVMWSPSGIHFALVFESWIDVYAAESGRVRATFPELVDRKITVSPVKRISATSFISDDVVAYSFESGLVCSSSVKKNSTAKIQAHSTRVKAIAPVSIFSDTTGMLVTAASNGEIKLWRHHLPDDHPDDNNFQCLASLQTDFRILSMVVWHRPAVEKKTVSKGKTGPKRSPKKAKKSSS